MYREHSVQFLIQRKEDFGGSYMFLPYFLIVECDKMGNMSSV